MAYTPCYPNKRNWANLPSESSPINETNLNAMDNAIYTNDGRIVELSGRLDTDETALGNKVDKQSGKGLSEIKSITVNPIVNTGTKIAEISYKNQDNLTIGYEIKNGVVVDSALSSSSENPVQNKVVKSAIDAKSTVSISDTLVTGDTIANLTIDGTTTAIKAPLVVVDDTPSATSENPLQNKAIYEMLNNLLPEETVQGNPIAISDASGLNAKACSVDLLPIQDLHGYDSPWAGGARGNYLAGLKDGTYEGNGAKAVVKNGVATLSGTTTAGGNALIIPLDKEVTLPNEQIYYHCMNSVANSSLGPSIEKSGQASSTSISVSLSSVNRIVDVNSVRWGVTVDQVRFYIASGITLSGTYAPMIMKTNTATDFIPYENICPISGRSSVEVKRTGKNLCNPADMYVFNSNKYFATTNYTTRPSIQVAPNTQYILSCRKGVVPGDYKIYYWDSNNTAISNEKADPFTTPSNCVGISFYCGYGDGDFTDADNVKAQVEVGSTATAYEPYQGETYTETLGQTVYGGNVDFVSGELTDEWLFKTITSVNSIGGSGTEASPYFFRILLSQSEIGVNTATENNQPIANYFKTDNNSNHALGGTFLTSNGSALHITFADQTIDTTEKANTYLTNNPLQVAYKLSTPAEITLTAEQISLLKGNNVVSTDGDSINLVYSADIGLYIAGQLQNS